MWYYLDVDTIFLTLGDLRSALILPPFWDDLSILTDFFSEFFLWNMITLPCLIILVPEPKRSDYIWVIFSKFTKSRFFSKICRGIEDCHFQVAIWWNLIVWKSHKMNDGQKISRARLLKMHLFAVSWNTAQKMNFISRNRVDWSKAQTVW